MRKENFLFLFSIGLTLLMPARAENLYAAQRLEVSSSPSFSVSLTPYLEPLELEPDAPAPTSETITEERYHSRFSPTAPRMAALINDNSKWYRVRLFNPEKIPLSLIWYNTMPVYKLTVLLHSEPRQLAVHGFSSAQENHANVFFPAGAITVPPGEFYLYFEANTAMIPFTLAFALDSPEHFAIFHFQRTIILAFFIGGLFCLIVFLWGLFFRVPSRFNFLALVSGSGYFLYELIFTGIFTHIVHSPPPWTIRLILHATTASAFVTLGQIVAAYCMVPKNSLMLRLWRQIDILFLFSTALCLISARIYILVTIVYGVLLTLFSLAAMANIYKNHPGRIVAFWSTFGPLMIFTVLLAVAFTIVPSLLIPAHFCRMLTAIISVLFGSLILGEDFRRTQQASNLLATSLKSVLSTHGIQHIIQSGKPINTDPVIQRVTVMFIDIVGYSLSSAKQEPMETFMTLKRLLNQLTTVIHQYNGIIDKSLGDGCLCFFGYDLVGEAIEDHELAALDCARQIQRESAAWIAHSGDSHIFPLRIGINTADVCIGNMGDESRFDFTIIGDGVVMASRFESACEPFKIVMGMSTVNGLSEAARYNAGFHERQVAVKHGSLLVTCMEVNPFIEEPQLLNDAQKTYRRSLDRERAKDRHSLKGSRIILQSEYGAMELINISRSGCCLNSPRYLGKGVNFEIELTPFERDPLAMAISPIRVEVVWGVPEREGVYQLGAKFLSLNDRQREFVVNAFLERSNLGANKAIKREA